MIPLPSGFRVVLDRSVRSYASGQTFVGGNPVRALRLTPKGAAAVRGLLTGRDDSEAARHLGRRLVEAGLAHPRPPRRAGAADVTVVVPVRDRARSLDRCLAALGAGTPVVVVDDGSHDAEAIADVCQRHDARLLRRERSGGPAAARNDAIGSLETELVAFVDSDCVAPPRWLETLAGHFADPLVGAVAPRVRPRPPRAGATALERFSSARCPLDMGPDQDRVVPGGRVSYVPTAALVVRRAALTTFDAGLRFGEDVDLVWRLHDAGWRVRYAPEVVIEHAEPSTWRSLLRRRFRYGTSAGQLSRRHPGRLAHVVARPAPAAAGALLLARRPLPALALAVLQGAVLARRTSRIGLPTGRALLWSAQGVGFTVLGVGRACTMLVPSTLAAGIRPKSTRAASIALLVGPPLAEWVQRRPRLDPVRWSLACVADDVAYGAGVWRGCLRERTIAPLVPRRRPAR